MLHVPACISSQALAAPRPHLASIAEAKLHTKAGAVHAMHTLQSTSRAGRKAGHKTLLLVPQHVLECCVHLLLLSGRVHADLLLSYCAAALCWCVADALVFRPCFDTDPTGFSEKFSGEGTANLTQVGKSSSFHSS